MRMQTRGLLLIVVVVVVFCVQNAVTGFVVPATVGQSSLRMAASDDNNNNNNDDNTPEDADAQKWQDQAAQLRESIRKMEEQLGDDRGRNIPTTTPPSAAATATGPTLAGKRILVAGANGRLGSMVCRYLLRNHPTTEIVAAVHTVGENSPTARGYGRLSYEVGAEDGIGTLGAAWAEDRNAQFTFDPETMGGYNLQNLRLVEVELLDPVQCQTIAEGCDAVVWCATDFNGNSPRAVSGLNIAFLFRAVANPTKGRVEVEGLENMLGALKTARQAKQQTASITGGGDSNNIDSDPINFVLVSAAPDALPDNETPFGSFKGIKRQGEQLLRDFPSLSHCIVQLNRFEDNFVGEDLEVFREESTVNDADAEVDATRARRKINRRDAARAVAEALTDESLRGKTVQVWTAQ